MSALAAALTAARDALAGDPRGDLPRSSRHSVLRALGDGDEGRARRARLARAAAEHVLPMWQRERPGDDLPERALGLIEEVLDGTVDRATTLRVVGELQGNVDNLMLLAGLPGNLYAGYVASRAVMVALNDEPLDPPSSTLGDHDRDFLAFDTAQDAASAAAGGPPSDPGSDADARRRFWEWWLQRAASA